jgi:hypothetical protein
MNRQSDEKGSPDLAQREPTSHLAQNRSLPPQPRSLLVAWILLLLLGALFLFAALSDLVADGRFGLPTDHIATFSSVAGITWSSAQQASHGVAQYITLLETTYAVHELVFGLLFLIIVAIPFRRRARWAWWACWVPMLANLTYTFTFGSSGGTTLVYSLIADVALPLLLLLHIPAFFGKASQPILSA